MVTGKTYKHVLYYEGMKADITDDEVYTALCKAIGAAAIERHLDFFDNSFKITGDPKKIDFPDGISIAAEEDKCSK